MQIGAQGAKRSAFNAAQILVAQNSGAYIFNFGYTSGQAPSADALVDRVYVQALPLQAVQEPMSLALLASAPPRSVDHGERFLYKEKSIIGSVLISNALK